MDKYIRKDGTSAIYVLAIVDQKSKKIPLKLYCEPIHWDEKRNELKKTAPDAAAINMIIRREVGHANDIAIRHRLQGERLTVQRLVELMGTTSSHHCFLKYMEGQIALRDSQLKPRTRAHHICTLGKLHECFYEGLPMSALDHHAVERFYNYMLMHGLGPNTITGNLKRWKVYVRRAIRDELINADPFQHTKMRYLKGDRISLTREELRRVEELYESPFIAPAMAATLQCFLFSCYTGIRVSDIKQVSRQSIINDELTFKPIKTEGMVKIQRIPLNKQAKHYLNVGDVNWRFHPPAEQTMNLRLKEAASILGITKTVTYHVSRHTFATLFLKSGGTLDTLQQLLGHSSIETTMIYVHVSTERKREQIDKM